MKITGRNVADLYSLMANSPKRLIQRIALAVLLCALVLGAGYRIVEIKDKFAINNGFEFFVNMASHFWSNPGGYNFEEALKMKAQPDEYIFSRHPKEQATASFENEKGWAFILSLLIPEGTKGLGKIALIVVQYQLMLDLAVVVLLFYAGRSLAGFWGATLAALLYALFKPSIRMMSWVAYYYWPIPLATVSLFFWTVLYKPEQKKYSLAFTLILFFLYGAFIGFATFFRLGFLFLPLFLSPLLLLREGNVKRFLVLSLAMFIGQAVALLPQVYLTHKWYGKATLSIRGKWHTVISGLGAYPNPFGVKDTEDLTAVNWAIERGGPDLNKVGIEQYDAFMKRESLRLFKERPDIFLRNFKNNMYAGITLTPNIKHRDTWGPVFFGLMDPDKEDIYSPKILKFAHLFPWLVFFSILVTLFFKRASLWPLLAVVFQGLYGVGMLALYFPPAYPHITVYFPVFALLLAVALATLCKAALCIVEAGLQCWLSDKGIRQWHAIIRYRFGTAYGVVDSTAYKTSSAEDLEPTKKHKALNPARIIWLIGMAMVVLIFVNFIFNSKNGSSTKESMAIDERTLQIINSTLRAETNGGFEFWSSLETSLPDGWYFTHAPEGRGGRVTKVKDTEAVKVGTSSAKVEADSFVETRLVFVVPSDKLYYLLGRTIRVSGWVKSDNQNSNDVNIRIVAINGKSNPSGEQFYKNSGDWENIEVIYKVPQDAQIMYVQCNVARGRWAFFDGIGIKFYDANPRAQEISFN